MTAQRFLEDVSRLCTFLILVFITASIGAFWTVPSVPGWYVALAKPSWTPPSSSFTLVWTVLYILIAVAGWMAWKKSGPGIDYLTFGFYLVQLILNGLWSGCFFALRNPGLAMVDIVLLWLAILGTTYRFFRLSRMACTFFVLYLIWVSYAMALNFEIWRMNP